MSRKTTGQVEEKPTKRKNGQLVELYKRGRKKLITLKYVLPIKLAQSFFRCIIKFESFLEKYKLVKLLLTLSIPTFVLAVLADYLSLAFLLLCGVIYSFSTKGIEYGIRVPLFFQATFICKKVCHKTTVTAANVAGQLGIELRRAEILIDEMLKNQELVLADWDQENRVCSRVGSIPQFKSFMTDKYGFKPRKRNLLSLVLLPSGLAVKKIFTQRSCWFNEITVLHTLRSNTNSPKLLHLCYRTKTLYQSFIAGENLGSIMINRGVSVEQKNLLSLDDCAQNPHLDDLRLTLGDTRIAHLREVVKECHKLGVALIDIKYGNIILGEDTIFLCDFENSVVFPRHSIRFFINRQNDWKKLNTWFGLSGISIGSYKRQVELLALRNDSIRYAPIYIGKGVGSESVGSIEFGTGKWMLMKKYLPNFSGQRILDLGCNNALLPLEMLRAGAVFVKAFEYDSEVAQYAKLNHEMFELVDNKRYSFDIEISPMRKVLNQTVANFDIATAFCSLYYEEEPTMAAICRHMSRHVPIFIVQSNESAEEHSDRLFEKSSIEFLSRILAENGYRQQKMIPFCMNYDRPLIIGYSDDFPMAQV